MKTVLSLLVCLCLSACAGRQVYTLTCAKGGGDFNPFTPNGQTAVVGTPEDAKVDIDAKLNKNGCDIKVKTKE